MKEELVTYFKKKMALVVKDTIVLKEKDEGGLIPNEDAKFF